MTKVIGSIFTLLLFVFLSGCTNKTVNINPEVEKSLLQPETVDIYDIDINRLVVGKEDSREQIKNFPFVSLNPVLDYRGKFSDQYYDLKPYKVRAQRIDEVDFWKLQNNPYLVDFIYVLPVWLDNFKKVSNDLYQNIGYTYNLSIKEQEILKWWIEQGGVLWLETGIYTTLYDSYNKSGVASSTKAKQALSKKSENLNFMDRNLHVIKYQAEKVDYINYKKREIEFNVSSEMKWLEDINKLRVVVANYAEFYFVPDGQVLLKTDSGIPVVTINRYGKGLILSMMPFSYSDTRFDGELLRWKLMEYALDTTVLKRDGKITVSSEETEDIQVIKVEEPKKAEEVVVIEKEPAIVEKSLEEETVVTEEPVYESSKSDVKIIDMSDGKTNETAYCIQLYSDGSERTFMKTLEANSNVKDIRGEIRGRYYVIRAGKYERFKDALNDLNYYKRYFKDAFVRECAYKN